ncbi:MAG: hypothetical protein C0412_20360 [Flavobacterium sp.]|nr:hypothetical protein [Flavobacterium sp.]
MKVDSKIPREWFSKGDDDLSISRVLFKEGYYNDTGFHSQQAVEKYFIGYVVLHNLRFEKKHNLETLLKVCSKLNNGFEKFLNGIRILDNYYIPTRYPVPWANLDKKLAEESIKITEKIIIFINDLIE